MDFVSEVALNALASATTPHDAERAASECDRRAEAVDPDSPQCAGNRAAATVLRHLATTAPRAPRALTISYTGLPVRLDPTRIDEDEHVVPDHLEPEAGEAAARLFMDAVHAGAIVAPANIRIECYGDDDTEGAGLVLVAFGATEPNRGVTCGWRDLANISGDTIEEALSFIVAELNAALGVAPLPSRKLTRVAIASQQLPVRAALSQIVAGDPSSALAATGGGSISELANLDAQTIEVIVVEAGPRPHGYTVQDLDILAETFPGTPLVVVRTPDGPAADMVRPFAKGGVLDLTDLTTRGLRDAIAQAAPALHPTRTGRQRAADSDGACMTR